MVSLKDIARALQARRKSLGLEQSDMYMRIGMKQQQYQRVEAGSDVRLSTLLRVLEGLDLTLTLTPKTSQTIDEPVNLGRYKDDDNDDLDFWLGTEHSDDQNQ
ncbi:transcriptional regulator [Salinivibrio sp. ML198]|uniref:helix-turn-helix domain-containing protein n=1 Tax=unclassified Salinivibrio TaxID=2636825 RepID=UPI000984C5E9|nr:MULTISPECIES: helix-turn-helix domain-containing protein [unclassified Salinivibrio]OOE69739.1 transcriptional regulator [Salinivibrio sp. IB868]OOE76755.1 transcriptional regulator [Salinivibrio sp. IB870]OOE82108.1 transcriptional regulator [Salinivibrio sp. ML198]